MGNEPEGRNSGVEPPEDDAAEDEDLLGDETWDDGLLDDARRYDDAVAELDRAEEYYRYARRHEIWGWVAVATAVGLGLVFGFAYWRARNALQASSPPAAVSTAPAAPAPGGPAARAEDATGREPPTAPAPSVGPSPEAETTPEKGAVRRPAKITVEEFPRPNHREAERLAALRDRGPATVLVEVVDELGRRLHDGRIRITLDVGRPKEDGDIQMELDDAARALGLPLEYSLADANPIRIEGLSPYLEGLTFLLELSASGWIQRPGSTWAFRPVAGETLRVRAQVLTARTTRVVVRDAVTRQPIKSEQVGIQAELGDDVSIGGDTWDALLGTVRGTTDSDGQVVLSSYGLGPQRVRVLHGQLCVAERLVDGSDESIEVLLDHHRQVPATGTIHVRVTDGDCRPVSGATVHLNRRAQPTDDDGSCVVEDVEPGFVYVEVDVSGLDAANRPRGAEDGTTSRTVLVREGESVDLSVGCGERPGTFRGTLVDETGRPLAWVASLLARSDEVAGVASSDPDGDAVIADLPPFWYRLDARLGSTTWRWKSGFEVLAGKTMRGQYRLGSRTVRGRLNWPADRPRPERPRVVVTPATDSVGGWANVATSGDFTIDGALPGTYLIECRTGEGDDILLARARVDVPKTEDVSGVNLEFRRTGTLAIDVRRPDGCAIPYADGRLEDEQRIQIPFPNYQLGGDPKLAVFVKGIPEGDYRLFLRPGRHEEIESSIRIEGGRTNQYVFHVGAEKSRAPKVVRAGARTAARTAETREEPQAATAETAEAPDAATEGPTEGPREPDRDP